MPRYLIAAGVEHYECAPSLPSVPGDLARVVACFEARGYERVLQELGRDPTSNQLRQALGDWLRDQPRTPSDHLVLYYSGHGVQRGDAHFLLSSDSRIRELDGSLSEHTAFGVTELARMVADSEVQHALIILDACYAGTGVTNFVVGMAQRWQGASLSSSHPAGIHVVSACHSAERAQEGSFSAHLCEVLTNEDRQLGPNTQRYLRPDDVVRRISDRLRDSPGWPQEPQWQPATPTPGALCVLIDNPWFASRTKSASWRNSVAGSVFVGRESELEELRALVLEPGAFAPVVICALQGMAGVGKTRMVQELAHRYPLPGGMQSVVLDPTKPRALGAWLDDLVDRVGLSEPYASEGLPAALEQTLVHIDNADDRASAELASELAWSLPGVPVIVTGRYLQLGRGVGWQRMELNSFDTQAALIQLRAEVDTWHDGSEPEYIAMIRELGGLPLAIHLAAGHLNAGRTPCEFLKVLVRAGHRVKHPDPSRPTLRHTTLADAFELSLELLRKTLGEEADAALSALAQGPLAGFGPALGAAIAGIDDEGYEELIFHSRALGLVREVPVEIRSDRAHEFHRLVRTWLQRKAAEEPPRRTRRRWSRLFGGKAPEPSGNSPSGPGTERWAHWIAEQMDEAEKDRAARWGALRAELAALVEWLNSIPDEDTAATLTAGYAFALDSGPFNAWIEVARRARELTHGQEETARLLGRLGHLLYRSGAYHECLQLLDEKRSTDDALGSDPERAITNMLRADILTDRGELEEALRTLREEVLPAYQRIEDQAGLAATKRCIASNLLQRGEFAEGLRILREEALPTFERLGAERAATVIKSEIADVKIKQGELDEAYSILSEEVIPVFERLGSTRDAASAMCSVATILTQRGESDVAFRILRQDVLPVFEQSGDVQHVAATMGRVAEILRRRGNLDGALQIYREDMLRLYERIGDVRKKAATMAAIAGILFLRDDDDEALRILRRDVLPIFERLGDRHSVAQTMEMIAAVLSSRGQQAEALRIWREEAMPLYERAGDQHSRAAAMASIAFSLLSSGELDQASQLLDEATPILERMGDSRGRTAAMATVAEVLIARGDLAEALQVLTEDVVPHAAPHPKADAMGRVADILVQRGELIEALRIRREEQIPVYDHCGDVRSRADTMGKIADTLTERGELAEALRIRREEQIPVYERLGARRARASVMGSLNVLLRRGIEQLSTYSGDTSSVVATFDTMADVGNILWTMGRLDEAVSMLRAQISSIDALRRKAGGGIGPLPRQVAARANTAQVLLARRTGKDLEEARSLLAHALREADQLQLPEAERIRELQLSAE